MPTSAYDSIADWYDQLVRSGALAGDLVLRSLFTMLGDIQGQTICDLGCGQGRIARMLAQAGAQVLGVDSSARLIALAQRDEVADPLGITYLIDDAQTLTQISSDSVEGVVCNLALMDMPNLDAVVGSIARILHSQGSCVCSITHPCFESPHAHWETDADGQPQRVTGRYFAEGFWRSTNTQGVRGQVGAYHRTLTTYLQSFLTHGFRLQQIVEPQPNPGDSVPTAGYHIAPAFLVMRWVKGGW